MLTLNTSSLSQISSSDGILEAELSTQSGKITKYLEKIHTRKQGFYSDEVLKNEKLVKDIQEYANSVKGKYDAIVLLGIGGSSLGPIALREAFGNLATGTKPKLHVLDNIDPDYIAEVEATLHLDRTLFLVITKSGGTPETVSQYLYFSQKVEHIGFERKDHFVFITDPEKGLLREDAKKMGIPSFPIPDNVGGRFSVLSAVGLVPAALLGIDIVKLLQGARDMREKFLSENMEENLPFRFAAIQYLLREKGKYQNVIYPYSQKLFRIGDWFRQLLAESTGKKYSESGEEIFTGITPIAALGATDQHSQNQLYFEGPNDKFFIFLAVEKYQNTVNIPEDDRIEYLKGVDFGKLLQIEMEGTKGALTEVDRPHVTITIPKIDEESIGEIFILLEGATAFLGEFLEIDAFDQPGVELSKNITKELLLKSRTRTLGEYSVREFRDIGRK